MTKNKSNKRLFISDPDKYQQILSLISEIERLTGIWSVGNNLTPQFLDALKKNTIITSTGSSTRIEGVKLSDKEIIQLFFKGFKVADLDTRDEQEVVGYKELLENVFNSYKNISLNESTIKYFHPLIIIGSFILEFLAIHPFEDGNGRISRILANFLMLQYGYNFMPYVSHEKLIEDNRGKYYLSLNQSQRTKDKDISQWLIFWLEMILAQVKIAANIESEENIQELLSEKQLKIWLYILENIVVTPREIKKSLKIPTSTILQCLNKLVKLNKIMRLGKGRGTRYRVI